MEVVGNESVDDQVEEVEVEVEEVCVQYQVLLLTRTPPQRTLHPTSWQPLATQS